MSAPARSGCGGTAQPAAGGHDHGDVADFEVVTVGRVGVDLYPEDIGVPLARVRSFAKSLGGSPTNVAVAAARLGRRSAVVTKVGDDGFGSYVRSALADFGVDTRYVGTHPELRTPITFCEIYPPDHFPLLFYRQPTAPDMTIELADLERPLATAQVFWVTCTGLSAEPSRSATLAALTVRARQRTTILDLDHRPDFWSSPAEAGRLAREALPLVTVAVGNLEEAAVVVGDREPPDAAAALLDLGADLAVIKMGHRGVLARTGDGIVEVPPVKVDVLNGIGAGDAFGGALCHALLGGRDLPSVLAYANAAGAIVASRLACADAMPTDEEIDSLLRRAMDG
jgi:5-dehydro-2-deoxygluconokinase